jgi:hypothetical protein
MTRTTDDPNDPDLTRGADPIDGQRVPQAPAYLVLSEAERAKGFVRPVRRSYMHMTCGAVTTMGQAIAETYAREPGFYGSTYCTTCGLHRPVGDFRWDPDGSVVGS